MDVFLGGNEDLDFLTETTKASGKEPTALLKWSVEEQSLVILSV